jgi:hypothetical protein
MIGPFRSCKNAVEPDSTLLHDIDIVGSLEASLNILFHEEGGDAIAVDLLDLLVDMLDH